MHSWEFEKCDLCDLELSSNYLKSEIENVSVVESTENKYINTYKNTYTNQKYLSYSNRGPPQIS